MKLNLKRAASLHLFAAAILVAPFFTSCDTNNDWHDPEVLIKNEIGDVIAGDSILVKIGAISHIKLALWYEDKDKKHLYVWKQIDGGEPINLSGADEEGVIKDSDDLFVESGYSSGTVYGCKEMVIRTAFSAKFVSVGSLVKICGRVGNDIYGEVCYKVVE